MTHPTPEQITQAYIKLSELCDCLRLGWSMSTPNINVRKQAIFDALPPIPEPTMAEIEWNDDKHFLAKAHTEYESLIMLTKVYDSDNNEGYIQAIVNKPDADPTINIYPASKVIPTGQRYTI